MFHIQVPLKDPVLMKAVQRMDFFSRSLSIKKEQFKKMDKTETKLNNFLTF